MSSTWVIRWLCLRKCETSAACACICLYSGVESLVGCIGDAQQKPMSISGQAFAVETHEKSKSSSGKVKGMNGSAQEMLSICSGHTSCSHARFVHRKIKAASGLAGGESCLQLCILHSTSLCTTAAAMSLPPSNHTHTSLHSVLLKSKEAKTIALFLLSSQKSVGWRP